MDEYGAFVVTVPVPHGTEWPVLKSAQEVEAETEGESDTE
jgi:hypothetical protein